jgi:protein gp37
MEIALDYEEEVWLDWVICGGESGAGARPMHPVWARGLRDACVSAYVPFFFKQWGEFTSEQRPGVEVEMSRLKKNQCVTSGIAGHHTLYTLVGKKAAGHLLDGVEWHQFPTPQQVKLAGDPDPEVKHG